MYLTYLMMRSLSAVGNRLCENCEEMSHACDANVRFLSYLYFQTGLKDVHYGLLVIQRGSL